METVLFSAIVFIAALVQGLTGFGFALIAAPLALTFIDKEVMVVSLLIIGIFLNAFIINKIHAKVSKKIFIPIVVSSLIGMPVGIFILRTIPLHLLQIAAGVLSIVFTLVIYFSRMNLHGSKILTMIAGFISGLLQTSTTMSGPPVVLLLAASGISKDELRKTLLTYFLLINIIGLLLLVVSRANLVMGSQLSFWAVPTAFLGGYLGNKLAKYIPQYWFKVITLIIVCITGLIAIYSGLW